MSLEAYGWNESWAERLAACSFPHGLPARVVEAHRGMLRVHTGSEELPARASGRLRHRAAGTGERPAVGDWVVVKRSTDDERAAIREILPRGSKFSRKAAGARTEEQVVAANVDYVWIVSSFGPDLNAARIERYLTLVWQSGASPVVVVSKSDLERNADRIAAELSTRIVGAPIHAVSAVSGAGLESLQPYLGQGKTIALLGSSGVGKSTLLNRLVGREVMRTAEIREDDGKGRHTTTHRQLVLLPSGGLLLDTPGMREIQLWDAGEGLERSFTDIDSLADGCRFADCGHESEPDCAVTAAVENGDLAAERLDSFHKLRKEQAFMERKIDVRAEIEERKRWKEITKEYRRHFKDPRK